MVSNEISALLNQAVMLVAQTLEVEYCHVLELQPGGKSLLLRAGVGWKDGLCRPAQPFRRTRRPSPASRWSPGEAVVFENLPDGCPLPRFIIVDRPRRRQRDHAWRSAGHGQAFGVLGAHTAQQRKFTEDEIHFLFSLATVLAMAVERIRAEAELQKLAAFVRLNPNPAMELAGDGAITLLQRCRPQAWRARSARTIRGRSCHPTSRNLSTTAWRRSKAR